MADLHEEDAPDVDYEGEEDDEEVVVEEEHAQLLAADDIHGSVGGGADGGGGGPSSAVAKGGAGDSETEDDGDDEDGEVGPRTPKSSTRRDGDEKKASAGDSETSSGSEGEMEDDRRRRGKKSNGADRDGRSRSPSRSRSNDRGRSSRDNNRGYENGRKSSAPENGAPQQLAASSDGKNNNNNNNRRLKNNFMEDNVGVYIPPAKRRMLEMERKLDAENKSNDNNININTTSSDDRPSKSLTTTPITVQRQSWENLKRSINGTINRLSPSTIKPLIHTLFTTANLLRGRGILARSLLRASQASPQYAPSYAALMAVINTKLPECGELLLTRAILAFRRGYKTRDRNVVSSTLSLLGHLFNQGMAHELLSLQILTVLLDGDPTEDSVDVAVGYMCVVGRQLSEVSPAGVHAVMERFRGLLHEGSIGRRAQYRIESLLKIKKGGFRDYPTIPDEENLDLVEREDQITFELGLDDEGLKKEEGLDVFHYDEEYDENEAEWAKIRAEILGDEDDSSDESGSDSDESEDEKEIADQEFDTGGGQEAKKTVVIQDLTETDLVHLRRTIYLTIMSSATFEECTHKLAKMDIPEGKESELINMIIECCSQERTFLRYYGLVSGRFCLLHERWQDAFEEAFATQYNTIHRLETNKLRNVAKLFGHLLHTDSISWSVLSCIHLNEDETTSSSRIFIKILVQEMAEAMGMVALKVRFDTDNSAPDGELAGADASTALVVTNGKQQPATSTREWFKGMFPKDNARNTRYAINFFTSIGLGPLTDGMREFLKNAPKLIMAQAQAAAAKEAAKNRDDSDASSVISSSSSDTSSYDSSSSGSYSSSSSSSHSSSSYSSGSRRKKSSSKRGRGRRRGRSYSSSSSSGSFSRSSRSSRGRGRKSSKDKRDKRRDKSSSIPREIKDSSIEKAPKDDNDSRRSVSVSPKRKRRDSDRRSRSNSGGRSRSPSRSPSPPSQKKSGDSRENKSKGRRRNKRSRSPSYSSASSRSASRPRSPPSKKKYSKSDDKEGRKKSRRSRGRSDSESDGSSSRGR